MDSIQRHAGYWWVPNHQDKMITGTLYIEEDGNAYLETIGLLDEDFIHKTYYDVDNVRIHISSIWYTNALIPSGFIELIYYAHQQPDQEVNMNDI